MPLRQSLTILTLIALLAALPSCNQADDDMVIGADFEAWYPQYNRYISNWLAKQVADAKTKVTDLDAKLETENDPEARKVLETSREEAIQNLERMQSRQALGDYFEFKEAGDLPPDLVWENGSDEPEIGDPASKKGGTFRYYIPSFPPTIRQFGPEANNSFRSSLYEDVELGLVGLHPETGGIIPGVAKEWAVGADNKTVYFRLDPEAKYNAGGPVGVIDFMWFVYVRASDNVNAPWFK
jgi:microcin C transport system substrate-binding protein